MIRNYGLVESVEELREMVDRFLAEKKPVGLDIETGYDGPDKKNAAVHPEEGFVVGISLTNSLNWARYIPLRHDYEENFDNTTVAEILWPLLKSGLVVAHNAKFELSFLSLWVLYYLGAEAVDDGLFEFLSDTMIEAAVVGIYRRNGLKELVSEIFHHEMVHFVDLFEGAAKSRDSYLRFNVLPLTREVVDYAYEDALWSLALHDKHYEQIKDHFIYKLEMEVMYVVAAMEKFGIYFNWAFLRDLNERALEFNALQHADIQDTFSEMCGEPVSINLASPAQVKKMLYDRLGYTTTRYTKGTKDTDNPQMSTDTIALEGLAQKVPVIRKLIEYKEVKKLIDSYLKAYERDFSYDLENEGAVHPNHNQVFVISGRFSTSKPNYQQLPGGNTSEKNGKLARYESCGQILEYCFRDAVVVPEGYYGVGFDYGQAELRALAGDAKEEALLAAFAEGVDVHIRTAALMLRIPEEKVEANERGTGKTMNFLIGYGGGPQTIAERLGIPLEESKDLFNKYIATYPNIKKFADEKVAFARKYGFALTKFGRKMMIWSYKDAKSSYQKSKGDRLALNSVIQGSATGDVPKIAMVRASKAIEKAGLKGKIHLVMNIHDNLEFYVRDEVPLQQVMEVLEPAVVFPVPGWPEMVADWHTWTKWGSAEELHKDESGNWVKA